MFDISLCFLYVNVCVMCFQVISLEGWVDIMYYIQDVHTYWVWVYFLALIVVSAANHVLFVPCTINKYITVCTDIRELTIPYCIVLIFLVKILFYG